MSGKGKEIRGQKGNVARSFTFRELAAATRNFRDVNLIGEGGFGMVYKGRLESGQASCAFPTNPVHLNFLSLMNLHSKPTIFYFLLLIFCNTCTLFSHA